uniref:phospholipase A2 n=2 Tax=Gouania willdenowi TaxID=441366 RepID=A0A8C5GWB0_GOUWI
MITPRQRLFKSCFGGGVRLRAGAVSVTGAECAQRVVIMWSVIFVFLSYLDRNLVRSSLDADKESRINGISCAKVSTVEGNLFYQVTDGAEVVRSTVSRSGTLVNCSVSMIRVEVQSFVQQCRMGTAGGQDYARLFDARYARLDEAKDACSRFHSDSAQGGVTLRRSRRGFTYPGTLWCGAGNMADHYDQLGEFADTDSCCRTHDHCPHVIHAFSSKYGYTNFKWHSICHCDCDNALKTCLRKVNDSSSRVVGQAFFNVIGVPCFKFIYEEQCAERHWYGMCKRYEQFPIAVLEEAVPYDFGGIAVIDNLKVAPSTNKSTEGEKQDKSTQSTTASTEEPSLGNVVTAAEDFIKVLATVSTSQSSNAESDEDQGQKSEKKKKKNMGKKKKSSKKSQRKRKGRKRNQKSRVTANREEDTVVGRKAEEVEAQSNFISESQRPEPLSRNVSRTEDDEFQRKDKPSNKVMKDKPASDERFVYSSSLEIVHQSPDVFDIEKEVPLQIKPTPVLQKKDKALQRKRRKRKKSHPPSSEEFKISQRDETPTTRLQEQSIVEVRKNTWRETLPSPTIIHINPQIQDVTLADVPSIPIIEQQISPRPDSYQLKIRVTTLSPSYSVLKSQRLKEKTLRNRRRKIPALHPGGNTPLSLNSSDKVFPNFLNPETTSASVSRLFTTTELSVSTKHKQQKTRQRRKPRKPAAPAPSKEDSHFPLTTSPSVLTDTLTPQKATFAASAITPLQLSMERLRLQLLRKKRRKVALFRRTG